ncbi:MAG: NAD(P)-dependent alcohol dehydrogenase, partial [Limisphaerales bacterium]
MKAMVYTEYGPPEVLQLKEVEKPAPKENEVLIKVHAASVNAGDWHILRGKPFLVRLMGKPKNGILGWDVAGRVEAVGGKVTQFQPGDEVFGWCTGAFAEFVCAPENDIAPKPAKLTFEEAAAVPVAAMTALQGLKSRKEIQPGQKVAINGASGGVGPFAVQLAKSFGTEVTAVTSTGKVEQARSLGADFVIDYSKEDFTRAGKRYDRILAANGNRSIFDYKRALKPDGICVVTGGSMPQIFQAMLLGPLLSMAGKRKMGSLLLKPKKQDLLFIKELLEAGKLKPVIDRRYPLSALPEA